MSKNKTFLMISDEDSKWLEDHPISVWKLFHDCLRSDRFGLQWSKLKSDMTGSSFQRAKRKIEEYGVVKFRQDKNYNWEVLNLHGAYTHYWDNNGLPQYQQFLNSDYWQKVRQTVLERDNHTCQNCEATDRLHVHHLTYENHGNEHEHLEDLTTLCEVCHRIIHGIED